MFVAITSIQSSIGNPSPKPVAWIALSGQALVPILMLLRKYSFGFQEGEVAVIALSVSLAVVLAVTLPIKGYHMQVGDGFALKLKVALVLLLSIFIFIGIGRFSPEAAMAAYLVYCWLPLQRFLNLPITKNDGAKARA